MFFNRFSSFIFIKNVCGILCDSTIGSVQFAYLPRGVYQDELCFLHQKMYHFSYLILREANLEAMSTKIEQYSNDRTVNSAIHHIPGKC